MANNIDIFICATKTKKREIANIEFIYLYKGKLIVIVVIIAIFSFNIVDILLFL